MIIYKITNIINNKSYIGQTKFSFSKRYHTNWWKAKKLNIPLARSIKKYGTENFKVDILFEQKDFNLNLLNELEIHYIKLLNTLAPFGYNLTTGGDSFSFTESVKQKISDSKKGVPNLYLKNIPKTNEHKQKLREAKLGKKHNLQHIEKCRLTRIDKRMKSIKATNLDTNEILIFKGIKYAILFGFNKKGIHNSLNNTYSQHKNYKWEYITLDNEKENLNG